MHEQSHVSTNHADTEEGLELTVCVSTTKARSSSQPDFGQNRFGVGCGFRVSSAQKPRENVHRENGQVKAEGKTALPLAHENMSPHHGDRNYAGHSPKWLTLPWGGVVRNPSTVRHK